MTLAIASMTVQAIMIIKVIMIKMLWMIMFVRTLTNATTTLPNQNKVYNIKNCTILLIFVSLSFRVYPLSESSNIVLVSGGPGLFGLSRFRTGLIYDRPEITQAVFGPVPE